MAEHDRRRPRRTPRGHVSAAPTGVSMNSLVASAEVLKAKRGAVKPPEKWQDEAWGYYDDTPELRFACQWYAAALSRCRLTLGRRGAPGEDPTPLPNSHPALAILDDLGSQEGQSQLLSAFAPHLVIPGVAYIVAIDEEVTGGVVNSRSWTVLSSDDLRVVDAGIEGGRWEAKNDADEWGPVPDGTLPVKVWRRHARYRRKPDSPVRALLSILRELHLLSAHVEAAATSRLAGAGVFVIPTEATLPVSREASKTDDPFLTEFIDAMLTPIADREAASAVVPLLMRMPGEFIEKVQHITFDTPFDERALDLREEARRRFAAGMDMPAEVLLGLGDSNHWTAWQIEESAIKLHIVPMLETICEGLTVGWLRPTLAAARDLPPTFDEETGEEVPNPLASLTDEDLRSIVVWHDTSALVVRPDRSGDAKDLYDRGELSGEALLRECGFDPDDAPSDEERRRRIILRALSGDPTLLPTVLAALGYAPVVEVDPLDSGRGVVEGRRGGAPTGDEPPGDQGPATGPPATRDTPPPPPDEDLPVAASARLSPADEAAITDAAADAAVLTAADAALVRALEVVGSRARNLTRRDQEVTARIRDVAQGEVYLAIDVTCVADLDRLLAGAWDAVETVAERFGVDPAPVVDAVDRYARALLAAQAPHTYEALREALDRSPAPA